MPPNAGPPSLLGTCKAACFSWRFITLAHEISHYLLHREFIGDAIEDNALYRSALGDRIEIEANQQAARMLMPAALVRGVYNAGLRSLIGLAFAFQVSGEAMKIRLERLGLERP